LRNLIDGVGHFLRIRRIGPQPAPSGVREDLDRRQRLLDLVGDRSRKLAEQRHARGVRKLGLRRPQGVLGPPLLGDVERIEQNVLGVLVENHAAPDDGNGSPIEGPKRPLALHGGLSALELFQDLDVARDVRREQLPGDCEKMLFRFRSEQVYRGAVRIDEAVIGSQLFDHIGTCGQVSHDVADARGSDLRQGGFHAGPVFAENRNRRSVEKVRASQILRHRAFLATPGSDFEETGLCRGPAAR
jgi:hypothetical protein